VASQAAAALFPAFNATPATRTGNVPVVGLAYAHFKLTVRDTFAKAGTQFSALLALRTALMVMFCTVSAT
jgi:hypothetical protein